MIRLAINQDQPGIASIDQVSFSGSGTKETTEKWVAANFAQSDKYKYYVSENDGAIDGYVGWEIKGGFMRKTPVVELQRLAVTETARGKGLGTTLVNESLELVKAWIKQLRPDSEIMRVFIWSKKSNESALKIYRNICPNESGERNIYDTDEVLLSGEHKL